MINQDTLAKILQILQRLQSELKLDSIFLIQEDGQVIQSVSKDESKSIEKASILASLFSASKMLYEVCGLKGIYEVAQYGEQGGIFAFPVEGNRILGVISEFHDFPGRIQFQCRTYIAQLDRLFLATSKGQEKGELLFQNISDREIDDLFGGF